MSLRRPEEAANLQGHALLVVVLDAWASSGLERSALRDFPFGTGRVSGTDHVTGNGSPADSALPRSADPPNDSPRSAPKPSKKGRHADYGWTVDPRLVRRGHDSPSKPCES